MIFYPKLCLILELPIESSLGQGINKKSVYKYKQTSCLHDLRRARFAKYRNSALPAFNSSFSLSHTEICLLYS